MKFSKILILVIILSISLNSCHVGRAIIWFNANITDHKIFPYTEINTSDKAFQFYESPEAVPFSLQLNQDQKVSLDSYLENSTTTTAFLVIQNDSILFENYYRDYQADDISNIFSASKSITSLLVGIAFDEGLIKSIDEPITNYISELNDAAPEFKKLTIKHLLNMQSGIKFKEAYLNPFAEVTKLYYGENLLKQISKLEFEYQPGEVHKYQSVSTAILGILVEKVSGKELGQYLEEKVWKPMSMEHRATWSVDDNKNRTAKAFCCLNTTARDLAKIGRLYLNSGNWNGVQIVSKSWIEASRTPNTDNDCYQYQWYSRNDNLQKDNSSFYALGILGQYMFVNPENDLIIVRLGEKMDSRYMAVFNQIVNQISETK
jgi:CubicO group peptidase (beta-lactamase class C family)